MRELLERLAGTQPLVLVLEDLHWADGASLELVAHLLRRPPDAPLLLAGSYRPRQLGRALLAAIEAGNRAGKVECLELGPLAPGDAGRLVPAVDTATRDRLYVQSGGNPFYLLQLARIDGAGDGDHRPAGRRRGHRPGAGRAVRTGSQHGRGRRGGRATRSTST